MYGINRSRVSGEQLDVLTEYTVADGAVTVTITADGRYLVEEPPFQAAAEEAYGKIIEKFHETVLLDTTDIERSELDRIVADKFWDVGLKLYPERELEGLFHTLKYYMKRDVAGYGLLEPLMTDPAIEDILVSAPGRPAFIKHKTYGDRFHSLATNVAFPDDASMVKFINSVFAKTGNEPTVAKPGAVTYLEDKSRISVTVGNVISEPGSTIAIRKFPKNPYVITHMIESNCLTARLAAFVWSLLDAQGAGLVIGTTGSGKTTMLGALITMMNPRWRILTIEDSLELQIPHEDWVRYHTKKSTGIVGSEHDVTIAKLIDQSLTQKPDCEIIGEIRDVADAGALFQSMGTGHGGLCLPPNEMLPVRSGNTLIYCSVREAIDRFRDGESLYAYSMTGGRCGWHPITGSIIKYGLDDWRRFHAGDSVCTVHVGHPMLTERGVVPAGEVRPGDAVPVVAGLDTADMSSVEGVIPESLAAQTDGVSWESVESIERTSQGARLYDLEVRTAGNFTHGTGIVTHNTTFHANTPRGALTRMKLGGVSSADLTLLSFILYITQVRLEDGRIGRRVRNVTEVTASETGDYVLRDMFTYEPRRDAFIEVKNLLDTQQYDEACFRNSVRDKKGDMARREELLNECVARKAYSVGEVFGVLGKYYER